jgi:1,4-alpha-glucan branching enzyme
VHLKKSLFGKMPGDDWQKFANLRLLFTYQWAYPGKQLLFMGGEFAQLEEWNSGTALSWGRSTEPQPAALSSMLTALNRLMNEHTALSSWDCDSRGFEWLSGDDREQSVISFLRRSEHESLVVALNFTPVVRGSYRIPAPGPGVYREIFNSDAVAFGGSGVENPGDLYAEPIPHSGRENSLSLTLPPLSGVVLHYQP